MSEETRVIAYGLGPIGSAIARLVVQRSALQLVGGVDIDPAKVGRDIGEVIGLGRPLGLAVQQKLAQALSDTKADVALLTTSSYMDSFLPQIRECLDAGLDIVSTCEELAFPWLTYPQEAAEIDAAAKRAGRTVLGTGVNPGFLMDSLPLYLTAICQKVDHVEVRRVINASTRRKPFQAKIGSGLTVQEFRARIDAGRMGHVGLVESAGMVMDTLGRKLVRFETAVEPIIADRLVKTSHFEVQPGNVIGLRQEAHAYAKEGEYMTLIFLATLDAPEERDTIRITGIPNLVVTLEGTNGDLATTAIAVNAIRRVHKAAPGLVTMRDLPPLATW